MTNKEYKDWFGIPIESAYSDKKNIDNKVELNEEELLPKESIEKEPNINDIINQFDIYEKMNEINSLKIDINTSKTVSKNKNKNKTKYKKNAINLINSKCLRNSKGNIINLMEKDDENNNDKFQQDTNDTIQGKNISKKGKNKYDNDYILLDNKYKSFYNSYYEYLKVKYNCKEIIYNINIINNSLREIKNLENKNKNLYLEEKYMEQKWFLNYKSVTESFYNNIEKGFKQILSKENSPENENKNKNKKQNLSLDNKLNTNYNNGKKRKRK